jgi:catechol 2,3-dioxygenase-like lactoylglutathione lyase family enzyme
MELSDGVWPDHLPAVQVRIARPTDKLDAVLDFYCDDLGLPELYRTTAHGYQVVMVGLPGDKYHLEFTSHDDGSPGRAPTDENLLVFYFTTADQMFDVVARLANPGMSQSSWTIRGGRRTGPSPSPTRTTGESC